MMIHIVKLTSMLEETVVMYSTIPLILKNTNRNTEIIAKLGTGSHLNIYVSNILKRYIQDTSFRAFCQFNRILLNGKYLHEEP